ncbi:MAG: TadE family type IV pilus minor pilin [Pseudolysinimonas sp.]
MRAGDERGSVVAEFAVAMPAVMLVLVMLLGGVQLGGTQLRAQDAAADAARSWARGESSTIVSARLARQVAGANVTRSSRGDLVCATVTVTARGPLQRIGLTATGFACAVSGGR